MNLQFFELSRLLRSIDNFTISHHLFTMSHLLAQNSIQIETEIKEWTAFFFFFFLALAKSGTFVWRPNMALEDYLIEMFQLYSRDGASFHCSVYFMGFQDIEEPLPKNSFLEMVILPDINAWSLASFFFFFTHESRS